MSTRRCGLGSSTATPGSSSASWRSGPTIPSYCLIWVRSPSSASSGTRRSAFLGRSLAGSAPTDSIVRKLYALIARVHQMTGDSQQALRTCDEGLKLDPEDAELWFRKAVVHRHRGESSDAERCWRLILNLKRPDQFCSFDKGIYGHLTRRNLAALAAERGDSAGVRRLWEEVLAECPGDREALAKLGRLNEKTLSVDPNR